MASRTPTFGQRLLGVVIPARWPHLHAMHLDTVISYSTLHSWKTGARKPRQEHIETIARHAKVTPEQLVRLAQPSTLVPYRLGPMYHGGAPHASRVYMVLGGDVIKIGVTKHLHERIQQLRWTQLGTDAVLLASAPGDTHDESRLHRAFAHLRIRGELFRAERDLLEFARRLESEGMSALDALVSTQPAWPDSELDFYLEEAAT